MRICHLADVHWRGLSRHDEYRRAFSALFDDLRENVKPDAIVIVGDIVHSKTQGISPELIDNLVWWFRGMASICPVHVSLGNHDLNLSNLQRQDAISPVINALNDPRIRLYKQSGVYRMCPGFNWCVFSVSDEPGWRIVYPVPGEVNIALFHGSVGGSHTDTGWELESDRDVSSFDGYDFVMLGDIHSHQYLAHRGGKPYIAYPGSSIMQSYGELPGKGYLVWDIVDRDTFDVTFRTIPHDAEFRTIDWAGSIEATVAAARNMPPGSRIRVRATTFVTPAEIRQLSTELMASSTAREVVFKDEFDSSSLAVEGTQFGGVDLRNVDVVLNLFKEHFGDVKNDAEWQRIRSLIEGYMARAISEEETVRNVRWSINDLTFDNLFGYGQGNHIDFRLLSGITGVFGPNRAGKSSIIGAILYVLFNDTDRGAIKNYHIINTRKSHCYGSIDMEVNGKRYKIERQSVKHETRAGVKHAVTSLNFSEIMQDGTEIELNGEQRTDTERVIRQLIGTGDDCMLTSVAAQGDMNRFIDTGSSHRDQIISRFLDLVIFDKMTAYAKEDAAGLRSMLKSAPSRDWTSLLAEKSRQLDAVRIETTGLRKTLEEHSSRLETLKREHSSITRDDIVTPSTIARLEAGITEQEAAVARLGSSVGAARTTLAEAEGVMSKISRVLSGTQIDDLRMRLGAQVKMSQALVELRHAHEREQRLLRDQERSVSKLDDVPCGDSFPNCKYIRDSHNDRMRVGPQRETAAAAQVALEELERAHQLLVVEDLAGKVDAYEKLQRQETTQRLAVTRAAQDVELRSLKLHAAEQELLRLREQLDVLRPRVVEAAGASIERLENEIADIEGAIKRLNARLFSLATTSGTLMGEIERLGLERDEYERLSREWRAYELFMSATSKKGIPARIIQAQLPIINAEISRILHGVVDYTLQIEKDPDSGSTEVYIDYGDSRRLIELGSGMEKMISSLAIRVALQNASTLPRSDFFFIDEGFGTLDETNVEACNRLLVSLKRWFKHVIVISHVDGVKDIADSTIEISRRGRDAIVTSGA